jgi:tetratricopeptide (TPR) repeat protein
MPEYETVIAMNPNSMGAISDIGWCKFWIGRVDEAIPLFERAIRRNSRASGISYFRLGFGHLVSGRLDDASARLRPRAAIYRHIQTPAPA